MGRARRLFQRGETHAEREALEELVEEDGGHKRGEVRAGRDAEREPDHARVQHDAQLEDQDADDLPLAPDERLAVLGVVVVVMVMRV